MRVKNPFRKLCAGLTLATAAATGTLTVLSLHSPADTGWGAHATTNDTGWGTPPLPDPALPPAPAVPDITTQDTAWG